MMKKLITIYIVVGLMVLTTSAAYALPSDNFDDNSMDTSLWNLYQSESPNAWVDETNQRLELRSTGGVDGAEGYFANGWGLLPTHDFSFKIDFHFSATSGLPDVDAAVQFCLSNKDCDSDILIEPGYDSADGEAYHSFFYCALENKDNNEWSRVPKGKKERTKDDGTLYISYDASEDELYLSDTGYWADKSWITIHDLLRHQWSGNVVIPSFGGWSEGIALDSGDAYLDNFIVDSGVVVFAPPIEATVDIDPDTLNLQSKGKWITCYISLPADYNVVDINSASIVLNGAIKAEWTWVEEEEQVMMTKFSRSAVQGILQPGQVELTVSGELLNGRRFEGKDTITVINKGKP